MENVRLVRDHTSGDKEGRVLTPLKNRSLSLVARASPLTRTSRVSSAVKAEGIEGIERMKNMKRMKGVKSVKRVKRDRTSKGTRTPRVLARPGEVQRPVHRNYVLDRLGRMANRAGSFVNYGARTVAGFVPGGTIFYDMAHRPLTWVKNNPGKAIFLAGAPILAGGFVQGLLHDPTVVSDSLKYAAQGWRMVGNAFSNMGNHSSDILNNTIGGNLWPLLPNMYRIGREGLYVPVGGGAGLYYGAKTVGEAVRQFPGLIT